MFASVSSNPNFAVRPKKVCILNGFERQGTKSENLFPLFHLRDYLFFIFLPLNLKANACGDRGAIVLPGPRYRRPVARKKHLQAFSLVQCEPESNVR